MMYDTLLVIALWLASLFPAVIYSNHSITGPYVQSLLFLELFAFFAFFWLWRQQTLGMLAWRIYVVNSAGAHINLGQALRRFIGALLSFLCLSLGYLWIFIDPGRRSWSDLLSGTRVIYRPPDAASGSAS